MTVFFGFFFVFVFGFFLFVFFVFFWGGGGVREDPNTTISGPTSPVSETPLARSYSVADCTTFSFDGCFVKCFSTGHQRSISFKDLSVAYGKLQ